MEKQMKVKVKTDKVGHYDSLTMDYILGDFMKLRNLVVIYTLDDKELKYMDANEYFRWIIDEGNFDVEHKVFDIKERICQREEDYV